MDAASSDGPGDDMYLSVMRPDGLPGIEDHIFAAAVAAKDATKTKESWKEASKAVIKEDTAEMSIKEEEVNTAAAKKTKLKMC